MIHIHRKLIKVYNLKDTVQWGRCEPCIRPRIAQSNLNLQNRPKTKKTPYKQLPQPKFVYNSDSLGPAQCQP